MAARGMTDCDFAIADHDWVFRTTALWRWDDIAFMVGVTIQAVCAHGDLIVGIGLAACDMTDREALPPLITMGWSGSRLPAPG